MDLVTEVAWDYPGRPISYCGRRKHECNSEKHGGRKNGDFPSIKEKSFSVLALITKEGMIQGSRKDPEIWKWFQQTVSKDTELLVLELEVNKL